MRKQKTLKSVIAFLQWSQKIIKSLRVKLWLYPTNLLRLNLCADATVNFKSTPTLNVTFVILFSLLLLCYLRKRVRLLECYYQRNIKQNIKM